MSQGLDAPRQMRAGHAPATKLTVDLCCDVGEGFGNYRAGDDAALVQYLTSANVACGFHAGDPRIMETTVAIARDHGVAVGAHPGLPDLLGFGRRRMSISADDTRSYTIYQLGALAAFLKLAGMKMHHVSPHGAFWEVITSSDELAEAFCDAVRQIDPELFIYSSAGELDRLPAVAEAKNLRVSKIYCADLDYAPNGMLRIERQKKTVDPGTVAERAVSSVRNRSITAVTGDSVDLDVGTILLHGDAANSADTVRTVRQSLQQAGITVRAP
jgi:UPF0271 protein